MQPEKVTARRTRIHPWMRVLAIFLAVILVSIGILTDAANIRIKSNDYEAGSVEKAAASYIEENTEYLQMDRLKRMIQLLNAALTNGKTYADYYNLASTSIAKGEYEQALTEIMKCMELADTQDQALMEDLWMKKGALLALTNSYEDALECFAQVRLLNDQSAQAYYLQAQIRLEQTEYQAALRDLERYIALSPQDISAKGTLGEVYEALGRYDDALVAYNTVLSQEDLTDYMGYFLNRARLQIRAEKFEDAIKDYGTYLTVAKDEDGSVHVMRAACFMQLARYKEAVDDFYQAVALHYADPALCYEQTAVCQYLLGNFEAALQDGQNALKNRNSSAGSGQLYQQMGLAAMALKDYADALDYFTHSIDLGDAAQGNLYYRGVCALVLERYQEAVEDFTASLKESYMIQQCYFNRGVCYLRLEEYEKGAVDMKKATETGEDEALIASAEEVLVQLNAYFRAIEAGESKAPPTADVGIK